MKNKAAVVVADCLEAIFSGEKNLIFAYGLGANTGDLLNSNFHSKRLLKLSSKNPLSYYINEEEIVKKTDITKKLQEKSLSFIPSYRSSDELEKWAKKNKIELLSMPTKTQKKLEDKIWFDLFLDKYKVNKPASKIIKSKRDFDLIKYPSVLQRSKPGFVDTTFKVASKNEALQVAKSAKLSYPLLSRVFVEGIAVGVTILIGGGRAIFSGVRTQCSLPGYSTFSTAGIQWIPTAKLSKSKISSLEKTLKKLTNALIKEGFYGIASIDLILGKNEAWVIECNPRFTSATPHLSKNKFLFHNQSFLKEYISSLRNEELSKDIKRIPKYRYDGCYLEYGEYLHEALKAQGKMLLSIPRIGFYSLSKNKLNFRSNNINHKKTAKNLFLYNGGVVGSKVSESTTLGVLMSDTPLYTIKNDAAVLSNYGHKLLKVLRDDMRRRLR